MCRTSLRSSRGADRIALDEPLGQADDAELEAAARCSIVGPVPRVISTLPPPMSTTTATSPGTPTPYTAARWMSRASSVPEMTRGADAGLLRDRLQELAAVLGFADRARRDGDDLVDAVRLGQPPELRQHLERGVHRFGRERPAVEAAGAQADHLLLAVDDLERQVGPDAHDDHVERVGADVDGGEAHHG